MIACCAADGFAFSAEGADEVLDDEFELVLVVLEFPFELPLNPCKRSCRPQNVSAKEINPNVSKDFIIKTSEIDIF